MFFRFATWNATPAPVPVPLAPPTQAAIEGLFRLHPRVLIAALEQYYHTRAPISPDYRPPTAPAGYGAPNLENNIALTPGNERWDHLIYAYMIENTRLFEVFDRVVREYEAGERFETPDPDTALWLRTTEALFYRDLGAEFIGTLTSWLRPDLRATRRNTYYRLLGLDLNHGGDANRAYPYDKAAASNRDFVPMFEELLREVWRGAMNALNASGPNETDDSAITDRVRRLQEMLTVRRRNNNLVREEFWAVATMAWLHLTIFADTPIVRALKAEATSPADRLRKISERVGVPAHSKADAYFNMAFELSQTLTFIETSLAATQPATAPAFYAPNPAYPQLASDMRTIITQWSAATGREIKGTRLASGRGQLVAVAGGRGVTASNA